MSAAKNRMASMVHRICAAGLPQPLERFALTGMFNTTVKFAGTSGIRIEALSPAESTVTLANRRRVQNHIGGVHACGMGLLAESATGVVFAMNVPDTHIPLIKSMKVDYKRRAQGDLKAVASLTAEQMQDIQSSERGQVDVRVIVTDEKEDAPPPIDCEMIWAWVPKPQKQKKTTS